MDDALIVGMLQGSTHLLADLDNSFPGEPVAARQQAVERFDLDVLHRIVRCTIEFTGEIKANNVGMVKLLENRSLALEAGQRRLIATQARQHYFDRNSLSGLAVTSAVDA